MRAISTIICAAFAISAAFLCCQSACKNDPKLNILSPSGKLRAVVFNRNCGATTSFNTQLSITEANDKPLEEGGNVFVVDGNVPLKIQWLSETKLFVAGGRGVKVFRQEELAKGVAISYE